MSPAIPRPWTRPASGRSVADFEGRLVCARFADVRPEAVPLPVPGRLARAPPPEDWTSSLDRAAYLAGVRRIREHIAAGEVYQANLCRVLSAPLPGPAGPTSTR